MMFKKTSLATVSLLAVAMVAHAEISVTVVPAFGPNGFTSPNWNDYVFNAVDSLYLNAGLGPYDAARNVSMRDAAAYDAAAYEITGSGQIHPKEVIVSVFPSWRGKAFPNSTWAGPNGEFLDENGNRVHFGLHVMGDTIQKVSLKGISWNIVSDDVFFDTFNSSGSLNVPGISYSPAAVGVDWGPDRIRGNDDDVFIFGGPGHKLVDEILYVGAGTALESAIERDTAQASIALTHSSTLLQPMNVTATYTIDDLDGTGIGMGSASFGIHLAEDFNIDNRVDAFDFGILFANWGALGENVADTNFDEIVDAADAGRVFGRFTGDPAAAGPGMATAEYNHVTGGLLINANGVVNVFVEHSGGALVPEGVADAPAGLLKSENASRVGLTGFGGINVENWGGGIGSGHAEGDLTLVVGPALGQPSVTYKAGSTEFAYVPEPASCVLLSLGLLGLMASRRR